jgi:Zn-dependent protease with chaperone function
MKQHGKPRVIARSSGMLPHSRSFNVLFLGMVNVVRSAGERWLTLRQELGGRLSKRLFDDLSGGSDLLQKSARKRISLGLAAAYVAATLVYATSLAFGVLGAFVLIMPWGNILTSALGVILVILCLLSRPRITSPPDEILRRADFPALYGLADRIAEAMGTKPVDGIAKSADFGANYRQAGWRSRRYIELGAPLLAILNHDERVAVIAHELSHGANRDPMRGMFLYGAVKTLVAWASTIRPATIGNAGDGMPFGPLASLFAIPFELLMLLVSELVFLVAKGMLLLVLRQSQRAEYLADRLAASVAGSSEMQSALEKTYLTEVVADAIRSHAWTSPRDPIADRLTRAVRALLPEQLEVLRTESLASQWQVDSTHPPTALRVAMLAIEPTRRLANLLSSEEEQLFGVEIDRIITSTQRELINRQLEADECW